MYTPSEEAKMIGQILSFLSQKGYKVWRQNNTGLFDKATALRLLLKEIKLLAGASDAKIKEVVQTCLNRSYRKLNTDGGQKGVPDVIGWHQKTGRWIAVEVKIGSDQLSEEQTAFLTQLHQAGGEVYVVRNFELFIQAWEKKNGFVLQS